MNLPNKLTVLRLIMVPVFFISYSLPTWFGEQLTVLSVILMLICYATAELSDLLDGKIARKYNLVTDLGKVMDPFADTLSHLTFFVCFMGAGIMPALAFIICMWREFSILFLRMLMMKKGKAVAANIWGKSKTVLYALVSIMSIGYLVLATFVPGEWSSVYYIVLQVFFYLAAAASLLSFTTYAKAIIKSKALSDMTR
ncbi:MAG: CDP-diacylglycerol--glycerol-3-phosphate 3-phosphatidyltransferase [Spirochaetales bacterium]|nr:CDP-diacylglycerol--glycerol-3-phosphate 3-phosphatidyltransferase [Spirochaetales bacterium]